MKSINFLIKPASGSCNMRCRYCFYEDVTNNREEKNLGMMSLEMADHLIDVAFQAVEKEDSARITFAFQGGEPTLAGLPFFRHFVDSVRKHERKNVQVNFALQTNGYSSSEEWAEFFSLNHFLLGLSVDGRQSSHDRFRVDIKGEGTFERVRKTLGYFQAHQVDYNALCVVTDKTEAVRTYRALKNMGFQYLQFIPCLDPLEEVRGGHEFSLHKTEYADFLCSLFEVWYEDWKTGNYVSIRLFDDFVHILTGQGVSSCQVQGHCAENFVIEADGSIYPCDFYVLDNWKAGNIKEAEDGSYFEKLLKGPVFSAFLTEGRQLPLECFSCRYMALCNSGCRRDRDYQGKLGSNYYCESYQSFFAFAKDRLEEIARAELQYLTAR